MALSKKISLSVAELLGHFANITTYADSFYRHSSTLLAPQTKSKGEKMGDLSDLRNKLLLTVFDLTFLLVSGGDVPNEMGWLS